MKSVILGFTFCLSATCMATEFATTPQDYRLPGQSERSTYAQHRLFQGTHFAIMYEQGGFQIGKPQIIGYCLWEKAGSVQSCQDDHDPRLKAFIQSLKGPTLECSNSHYAIEIGVEHGKFMMTTAVEAISEADGPTFIKWFDSEAMLSMDSDSDCPEQIEAKDVPFKARLRLCMKDLAANKAAIRVQNPGRADENQTLNCKDVNGFAKSVATDQTPAPIAPAADMEPAAGMRD